MAINPPVDLDGWKAIAEALGVDEKTARRWEAAGMPVYNKGPKLVAAVRAEITSWMMRRRQKRAA